MNKFVEARPYADPEHAARKIMEIANGLGDVWDGRLFTEKLNFPMLTEFGASPAEWRAGVDRAVENGWLWAHESGTYYRFTQAGKELFA
jgi:DNA-binding transcriptional regulator PaaX